MLCEIIEIARSAYYKWVSKVPSQRELDNNKLLENIWLIYNEFSGIYGYRRITMNINQRFNKNFNHKRIYRLMRTEGIRSVIRKKKKRYIKSTPQHIAENTLNREFATSKPNLKWVTDVTEFKYGVNKAYLSAIMDLYDNSIIAYVVGRSNNNPLVFQTLDLALQNSPNSKAMLHSDRGFQYTSNSFKKRIQNAEMTQSMSRVGKCIDNGPMEGFWGTIKSEMYYLRKFNTYDELVTAIDDYIQFYNHKRLQKRLNSQSPIKYRSLAA